MSNYRVDLRSDTVTRPGDGMRRSMAEAAVGDDVYGEDPTVNALEAEVAKLLGKPAALFVSSGTQSNLCALLAHCQRGDEYIAGETAHLYRFEAGGGAVLGGLSPQTLPVQPDGTLDLDAVQAAIKPDDAHFARSTLLCLENTQSGRALPLSYFEQARRLCDEQGLALHLDGARLFNAALATGADAAAFAACCDSVSLCLSKGLGAPVGSVLAGSADFIGRARRMRKMLGGGMRQAGVLAAAGLYALRHNRMCLLKDHQHAERIARALERRFPGRIRQATNMVFLDLPMPELATFYDHLDRQGVRTRGANRWVFHLDVTTADVDFLEGLIEAY